MDVGRDFGGAADIQHDLQQAEGWEVLGKTCHFSNTHQWWHSPPEAQRCHGTGVVGSFKINQRLLGPTAAVALSVGAAIWVGLGQLSHEDNCLVK